MNHSLKTILKNGFLYVVYFIAVLLITGYFSLSIDGANRWTNLILTLAIFPMTFFTFRRFPRLKGFLGLLPFLLYYILTWYNWNMPFNPLLPILLSAAFALSTNKFRVYIPIVIGIFSIIPCLCIIPHFMVKRGALVSPQVDYRLYEFISEKNATKVFNAQCVMLETWGKGCGACFQAMQDMDGFFKKLEKVYDFEHEYIYIGQLSKKDVGIFRSRNYLSNDRELFQDDDLNYYNQSGMNGYPYFVLSSDSQNFQYTHIGYDRRYLDAYKRTFANLIECNCPLIDK